MTPNLTLSPLAQKAEKRRARVRAISARVRAQEFEMAARDPKAPKPKESLLSQINRGDK
jgi:hypothetical protein